MGAGASKHPIRTGTDDPPTFREPSAPPPPPPFNPQLQGLPPALPQPQPHAHLYPALPHGIPEVQPNLPPGPHGPAHAVSLHSPMLAHPGPPIPHEAPSPESGNEYFLETPSIEVIRTEEPRVNQDALRKYFSHKKSHGGKISSITVDDDCFVITFEDMDVAQEVLSHPHVLEGTQLHVRHRKSPIIEVITDGSIDEDRLKMYFKNTRSSGGGPIDGEIKMDPRGVCYITFQNKRAAIDVVQKASHSIDGKQVVVSEKLNLIDRRSLLIKNIPPDCTSGHLRDYLEGLDSAQGRLHIAGLYRGIDESIAVASLCHDIDGEIRNRIAKEAKQELLKGQHVTVSPLVVTRSVQLSGLNKTFTRDLLINYFENTERSGGGKVLDIDMDAERGMATIRFKDPTVVHTVVRRPYHDFDCGRVSVCAHYDVLGTVTDIDFSLSSKMAFNANVPRVIKRDNQTIENIEPSKLCLLEKQLPGLKASFPNVDFDIKHDHITITGIDQEPRKARDNINEKLQEFEECRWSISDDLQFILTRDHTKKAIDDNLAAANVQKEVHVSVETNEVVISGVDKSVVDTAESCVRSVFKETSRKIPKEILGLRGWDDLMTQCKEGANRNAIMSCDKTGEINIVGLIPEVDDIDRKLVNFLKQNDFKTSIVDAERPIVNVLVKRQKDLLKKIAIDNEVSIDDMVTGFKILGPQDRMKKVSDEIKDLTSRVLKTTVQYKKPGLGKLFTDDTFKMQLKKVEDDQRCALQSDYKARTPLLRDKTKLKDLQPSIPSVGAPSKRPISVDIEQGNIESESADVIVNPVTSNSAFTVVGDALVRTGGQSVKDEFDRNWSKRVHGVLLSDAGALRCKKVAHMELPSKGKLKDAVCQCLDLSAQNGMKSIAFPAIGTGRYGMTSVESAKAIRDGIEQFLHQNPTPLLTDIKLTIFVQQMVADYKAEFRTTLGGSSTTGVTTPSPGQQEMSFGAIQMQVQQGDIVKERTDVLVSTILRDMEFTVVTKALVSAGGQSIADQLKTAWPSRTDKFVFTDAGTLPNKKVAHMVISNASELKDSVASCLREADKLGMKSISFPAMGTGGMMTEADCAKGIYSGVQEFSSQCNPKSLQLVRVTIFDGKMLGTFHSTMQQYTTASYIPPTLGVPSDKIGSVAVQIQQGDLAKETTDAVVNPVNTDGGFFEVGKALEKVGGPTIRTECQTFWEQRTNEVLLTDGGNLPCKKVIHAVCPNAKAMKGRVLECLLQAEVKGLTSVSFPAIGTGGFGVSPADAARETILGIKDFAITCNPQSVKLVKVTVFQTNMVAEFQHALQAAVPKSSFAPVAPEPHAAKIAPKTDVEEVVDVTFYACDKRDMDNAIQKVSETIDKHMTREHVDDDRLKATIRHLQQNEKDSIIQMGVDYLVLVTITGHDIAMVGLKNDVVEVRREIETFLREKKTAYDIEQLKKDITKVPDHWATPPPHVKGAYSHPLLNTSQEYQDVQKQFLSSVGYQPQIVSISRVQNEAKYKTYITELKERRKTCAVSKIEEFLYHGTAAEAVDNINQGGFNRNYCGKNATVYGDGVYFAKQASYSAQDTYSPPDAQGNKHIYQARVIVGEYTAGKSGLLEPPPKNPSNAAVRYDSVVNNVTNPSIFVVFHDTDAYPEYLIVFK